MYYSTAAPIPISIPITSTLVSRLDRVRAAAVAAVVAVSCMNKYCLIRNERAKEKGKASYCEASPIQG